MAAARQGDNDHPACDQRGGVALPAVRVVRSRHGRPLELPPVYSSQLFAKAAGELGYKPFPLPSANSSRAYTNPYGVRLGPCNMCGFCERFGCFLYSKAAPQTTILPILADRSNLEVRTNSYVTRILLDKSRTRATGVLYVDEGGQEVEQPADLVVLSAFQFHNVRLLLMSGVGKPYDPTSGQGIVGKNYAYQMVAGTAAFFKEDVEINPFIGAGAAGMLAIDELNSDHFDHSAHGFIGGSVIFAGGTGGRPIAQMLVPPNTPRWGSGWKGGREKTLSSQRHLHRSRVGHVVSRPLSGPRAARISWRGLVIAENVTPREVWLFR